jgi:2-hydroxy-6-oxonona-2,4-dienedioate hydrolase
MSYPFKEEGKFKYYEKGKKDGDTLVLLHGLMGSVENFPEVPDYFEKTHLVVLPILPIYDLPLHNVGLTGILNHIIEFIDFKGFQKVHLVGNSLGGHIALMYTLGHSAKVASMTLTGSSGLYESAMGNTFPKRGDYEFIKKKVQDTFYSPDSASQELIDAIFDSVNDRNKALRIVMASKSAVRHNLESELPKINTPTLLIWGKNDAVTPPFVGEKFHEAIRNSKLVWMDKCGHAPMLEKPEEFNQILQGFLTSVSKVASDAAKPR